MNKLPDWVVVVIVISLFLSVGVGISKAFEYVDLKGGSISAVFLILIGVVSWFVYMIQTDGFAAKKAKNDFKVMQMKNNQRVIESSRMKDV